MTAEDLTMFCYFCWLTVKTFYGKQRPFGFPFSQTEVTKRGCDQPIYNQSIGAPPEKIPGSQQGSNTHLLIKQNTPGSNMDEAMLVAETCQNIIKNNRNTSFYGYINWLKKEEWMILKVVKYQSGQFVFTVGDSFE